jgi:predicted phosphodiesterase
LLYRVDCVYIYIYIRSELLLEVYAGEKAMCMVEGDHNSPRTPEFFQTAASFLMNALQVMVVHGDCTAPVFSHYKSLILCM